MKMYELYLGFHWTLFLGFRINDIITLVQIKARRQAISLTNDG